MRRRAMGSVRRMLPALVTIALGAGLLAGAPLESGQPAASAAIFDAVKARDMVKVRALLETDAALVGATDDTSRTPLHWAARGTSHPVLALLVEKGARLDVVDRGGLAALHSLASRGDMLGTGAGDELRESAGPCNRIPLTGTS